MLHSELVPRMVGPMQGISVALLPSMSPPPHIAFSPYAGEKSACVAHEMQHLEIVGSDVVASNCFWEAYFGQFGNRARWGGPVSSHSTSL